MRYSHLIFLAFLSLSCSDDGKEVTVFSQNFSINKFGEDLTQKFFVEEMNNLINSSLELEQKTSQCSEGIREDQLVDYRSLWRESMMAFHRVHPHLKSGVLTLDFLEQDVLIERIYRGSFGAAFCDIQVKMIDQSTLGSSNPRVLGLSALEYALYGEVTTENLCNPRSRDFERVELWLSETSLQSRQSDLCGYLNKVSKDLTFKAQEQVDRALGLSEEVGVQALYSESALQKIYDSISQFVRDDFMENKINQPLGIDSNKCPANSTCPFTVEHRLSDLAFSAMKNNILGLEKILKGFGDSEDGLSFYLRINGHDSLVDEIYFLINEGELLLDELEMAEESFFETVSRLNSPEGKQRCQETSLNNRLEPVCALAVIAKELSDKINIDLKAALAVSSTQVIEGDSD
jgi:hypothetical protein